MFSDSIPDLFGTCWSSYSNLGGFSGTVSRSGRNHSMENLSVVSRYCKILFCIYLFTVYGAFVIHLSKCNVNTMQDNNRKLYLHDYSKFSPVKMFLSSRQNGWSSRQQRQHSRFDAILFVTAKAFHLCRKLENLMSTA